MQNYVENIKKSFLGKSSQKKKKKSKWSVYAEICYQDYFEYAEFNDDDQFEYDQLKRK